MNPAALRRIRSELGITQRELAKLSGYSERLIRKAEQGSALSAVSIINICQAFARFDRKVTPQELTLDIATIAQNWLRAFDTFGQAMIPHVREHLTDDIVFVCPGDPSVAPFIGTWRGIDGLQKWLDLYFGVFRRVPLTDASCTAGENAVNIRFLEAGYIGDQLCGPIRINMHFHFTDDGLIHRIDDDYDTLAGAETKTAADKKQRRRRGA